MQSTVLSVWYQFQNNENRGLQTEIAALSMLVRATPPLVTFLRTIMTVNETRRSHERKRTRCIDPSLRPFAKHAFRPFLCDPQSHFV